MLAGKSTVNRLEHAPRTDQDRYRKISVDEDAMKELFVRLFLQAHRTAPAASSLISTQPMIPSTAMRKAVSFTATTSAT